MPGWRRPISGIARREGPPDFRSKDISFHDAGEGACLQFRVIAAHLILMYGGGAEPGPSKTSRAPRRKACDECHSIKVRCVPCTGGAKAELSSPEGILDPEEPPVRCQRCQRLGLNCCFSPKEVVLKRKRRKVVDATPLQRNGQSAQAPTWPSVVGTGGNFLRPVSTVEPSIDTNSLGNVAMSASTAPLAFNWPAPPAVPDLQANQWEEWFRLLGTSIGSQTGQLHPLSVEGFGSTRGLAGGREAVGHNQRGTDRSAANISAISRTDMSLDVLSDPCLNSFIPAAQNSWNRYQADTPGLAESQPTPNVVNNFAEEPMDVAPASSSLTPCRSSLAEPSDASSSLPAPSRAVGVPSSSRSPCQSLEAQLSSICVDFSAALDLCDPSRVSDASAANEKTAVIRRRQEGEKKMLGLFMRAQATWSEIEEMGQLRVVHIQKALEERGSGSEPSLSSHRGHMARTATKILEKPLSTAGSMLALSLSFQMLDALRLLDGLLDQMKSSQSSSHSEIAPSPDSVESQIASILSSVRIDSCALPPTLCAPLLGSLQEHYTHSLASSLNSVISHARDWHEYEGKGCGPHHFCAVQVQGKRVVQGLQELSKKAEERRVVRRSGL